MLEGYKLFAIKDLPAGAIPPLVLTDATNAPSGGFRGAQRWQRDDVHSRALTVLQTREAAGGG